MKTTKQSKTELETIATSMIERLGKESPASLIVSDPSLFRYFGESFISNRFETSNVLFVSGVTDLLLIGSGRVVNLGIPEDIIENKVKKKGEDISPMFISTKESAICVVAFSKSQVESECEVLVWPPLVGEMPQTLPFHAETENQGSGFNP